MGEMLVNNRDPHPMEIAGPSRDVQALATQAVGRALGRKITRGNRHAWLTGRSGARSRPFDAALEQAAIERFEPILRALIDAPLKPQPQETAMNKPKRPKPRPRPAY